MYQDTFEEDDLIAEVELVAQARYSQNNDVDDKFDTEGMCVCVIICHTLNSSFASCFQPNNQYSNS